MGSPIRDIPFFAHPLPRPITIVNPNDKPTVGEDLPKPSLRASAPVFQPSSAIGCIHRDDTSLQPSTQTLSSHSSRYAISGETHPPARAAHGLYEQPVLPFMNTIDRSRGSEHLQPLLQLQVGGRTHGDLPRLNIGPAVYPPAHAAQQRYVQEGTSSLNNVHPSFHQQIVPSPFASGNVSPVPSDAFSSGGMPPGSVPSTPSFPGPSIVPSGPPQWLVSGNPAGPFSWPSTSGKKSFKARPSIVYSPLVTTGHNHTPSVSIGAAAFSATPEVKIPNVRTLVVRLPDETCTDPEAQYKGEVKEGADSNEKGIAVVKTLSAAALKAQMRSKWPWRQAGAWRDLVFDAVLTDEQIRSLPLYLDRGYHLSRTLRVQLPPSDSWNLYSQVGEEGQIVELAAETKPQEQETLTQDEAETMLASTQDTSAASLARVQESADCLLETDLMSSQHSQREIPDAVEINNIHTPRDNPNTSSAAATDVQPHLPIPCPTVKNAPPGMSQSSTTTTASAHPIIFQQETRTASLQHELDTSSVPRSAPPDISSYQSCTSPARPVHLSHVSLSIPYAGNPFASDALLALGLPSPLDRDQDDLLPTQEAGSSHSRSASSPENTRLLTKLTWKELGPGFGYELETLVEEPALPLSKSNLTGNLGREEIEDDLRTHASQDADASEQSDFEDQHVARGKETQRKEQPQRHGDRAIGMKPKNQGKIDGASYDHFSEGKALANESEERFSGGRPRADTTDTFASSAVLPARDARGSHSWQDYISNPSDEDLSLPPLREDDGNSWTSHSHSREIAQEHLKTSEGSGMYRRHERRRQGTTVDSSGAAMTTLSSVLRLPSISTSSFGCSAFHEVPDGRGQMDDAIDRQGNSSPLHSAGHGPIDHVPASAFTFVPPSNAPRLPLDWPQSTTEHSLTDEDGRDQQGRAKRTRPMGTAERGSSDIDVSTKNGGQASQENTSPGGRKLGHRRNTNDFGLPPSNKPLLRPSAPPFLPNWARLPGQTNIMGLSSFAVPRHPSVAVPAPLAAQSPRPAQMRMWHHVPVPTGHFNFTSLGSKAVAIRKPPDVSSGMASNHAIGDSAPAQRSEKEGRAQDISVQHLASGERLQRGGQTSSNRSQARLQTTLSDQDRQLLIDGLASKMDRSFANHSVQLEGRLVQRLRDHALQQTEATRAVSVAHAATPKAEPPSAPSDVYFDYVTDAIETQLQDLKKEIATSLNTTVSRLSSTLGPASLTLAASEESSLIQKMSEACGDRTQALLEAMRHTLLDDQVGKISKLMDERLLAALVLVKGERQDVAATVLESLASRLKRWDEIRDHFAEHIQVALINGVLPYLETMASRPQESGSNAFAGQDADLIAARVTELLAPIISDARDTRVSSGGGVEPGAIADAIFERIQPAMRSLDRGRTDNTLLESIANRLDKHAASQMAALQPVTSLFDPLLSGQEVLLSVANQMVRHQSDFQRQLGELANSVKTKTLDAPKQDIQHSKILGELLTSLEMVSGKLSAPSDDLLQAIRQQEAEHKMSASLTRDALDALAGNCKALCQEHRRLVNMLKDIDSQIKTLEAMRASEAHREPQTNVADTEALVDLQRLEEGRAKDLEEDETLQTILAKWSDEVSHLREEQARERELSSQTQKDLLSRLETAQKDAEESRKAVRDYLVAACASTESTEENVREALDRSARYEGEVASLTKRIADQDAKIGNLQTLTATQKQKAAEAQQKLAEFAKGKADSENQSQDLAEARARIYELEQRLCELEATEERLKSSEAMKDQLRGEISQYHEHFQALDEEISSMKNNFIDRAELRACQCKLADSQAEVSLLKEQLNEKESKAVALISVAIQTEPAMPHVQATHHKYGVQHRSRQATSDYAIDRSAGDDSNAAEQASWSMTKSEKSGISASVWATLPTPSPQSSRQENRHIRTRDSSGSGVASGSGMRSEFLAQSRREQSRNPASGTQSYTMSVRDLLPASSVRSQLAKSEYEEVVVVKREDGWWE